MGRTDGRPNSHIQEKVPPTAADAEPAPSAAEDAPAAQEFPQRAWRWATTVWAIVFLFLTALALFDLIAALIH